MAIQVSAIEVVWTTASYHEGINFFIDNFSFSLRKEKTKGKGDIMFDKELIAGIAGIDDWRGFEEFIKNLYIQNENAVEVTLNHKAKGLSGRNREVDVLVKFGFNPHILSLGIECKYWSRKVDGDIIDVAVAKRDDLKLDKYAVITTVGFEAGAELYAKSNGIDLFIIRPSEDDDFGYSGRVIKVRFNTQGSNPTNIRINAQLISLQGQEQIATEYFQNKFSNINLDPKNKEIDPELDLYRYSKYMIGTGAAYVKQDRIDNVVKLVYNQWLEQNKKFWSGEPSPINQRIEFSSPTAMFFHNGVVVLIGCIEFQMQYLRIESYFEVDRGKQYPLVLENVIENAVTHITAKEGDSETNFSMGRAGPKITVDLSSKPNDVVGRDGMLITATLAFPMGVQQAENAFKMYELVLSDGKPSWVMITPSFGS